MTCGCSRSNSQRNKNYEPFLPLGGMGDTSQMTNMSYSSSSSCMSLICLLIIVGAFLVYKRQSKASS